MHEDLVFSEESLPQRSPEWLEKRMSIIGGSEVASVLGLKVADKPQTLWKRKTGKLKPKKANAMMLRGSLMEGEALPAVVKELSPEYENIKIDKYFAIHPQFDYAAVSFDGVDIENKFIVELKCPNYVWNFRSVFTDGIPEYYYPQVQWQLFIANALWGIKKAYFASYYPDGAYILDRQTFTEHYKRLAMIDMEYNEEYCLALNQLVGKFHNFVKYEYWEQAEYEEELNKFKKCFIEENTF